LGLVPNKEQKNDRIKRGLNNGGKKEKKEEKETTATGDAKTGSKGEEKEF